MSAQPVPINQVLEAALAYGRRGFKVFPCLPGQKVPAGRWKELASADEAEIRAMFTDPRFNIGLACGPQPNGINLLAIDVDAHHGGVESWRSLMREHGRDGIEGTASHRTPNGGWHVFIRMPSEFRNSRNTLGVGIDTRASGGYVIVPPSRFVDGNGEVRVYRDNGELGLASGAAVFDAPDWVVEALTPEPPPEPRQRHVGQLDSPLDWLRKNADLQDEIVQDGWQVHSYNGNEVNYTRPGKSVRDGKSAVFHPEDDGCLVIFTTEIDPDLERLGKPTADRTGVTVNVCHYLAWRDHQGSLESLAKHVRRSLMPTEGLGPRATAPDPIVAGRADAAQLYPPREFYDQRPWMAACRQMAEAVGGSPSAHLLAFLTRWATLIPPGFSIPPINGAPCSFDLLNVIAGTSGSGKTSPMRNAAEMLPVDRKDLRMGLGLGSGEGIIEAFYTHELVEEGKKAKERRKTIAGVNFAISEGLIFAELAGRGGTTHVTRFCDGWSGAALSTANASAETFRHIDVNQYRLTLIMGIQAKQAHELMTDSAAAQGFVGRLLFVWAEEPRVKPRPVPPERLVLPVPKGPLPVAGVFQQTYLSYPPEVYTECQDANDARVGTDVPVEEHHHDLLRCKVAGVVALMDGRMSVSRDDWSIATALVDLSRLVRLHLYATRKQAQRDQGLAAAEARGDLRYVEESATERRYVAVLSQRIVDRTPDDGWTVRKAEHDLTSATTRHRFDPALTLARSNGFVQVIDGRITRL